MEFLVPPSRGGLRPEARAASAPDEQHVQSTATMMDVAVPPHQQHPPRSSMSCGHEPTATQCRFEELVEHMDLGLELGTLQLNNFHLDDFNLSEIEKFFNLDMSERRPPHDGVETAPTTETPSEVVAWSAQEEDSTGFDDEGMVRQEVGVLVCILRPVGVRDLA
jgi:hypothetical protein